LASALVSGTRGREFKSPRPDHFNNPINIEEKADSILPQTGEPEASTQHSPNISTGLGESERDVKFPKRLRHRGKGDVLATIYKRPDSYRLYWRTRVDGKPVSRMKDFSTYAQAKREGDKVVSDLHKGIATALTPGQLNDAQNAIEELQRYFQATGKRISIRDAVGQFCANARKLGDRPLSEAVDGFLSTVATVKRVDLSNAVEEFVLSRKPLTLAKDGKRPQLSPGYLYIIRKWLEEFAGTFPGHAVCDLSREHLDTYIAGHDEVSARTRNGRRTVTKMFLKWAVHQDMLPANHRLFSASAMTKEKQDGGEAEFYTPKELRAMLDTASIKTEFAGLLPVIALGGLAGIRLQEIARLEWADVFRVKGHVEISTAKSKTRSRRLVTMCPALARWLNTYRDRSGLVWPHALDRWHDEFNTMLGSLEISPKRNGLRHAFCTYHFALNANESLTAKEAGNSPQMIHAHYKGLATAAEARKWFAVKPAKKAGDSKIIQLKTAAN
jgi:integrase